MTDFPDEDPKIVPTDAIPSSSDDNSAPSTEFSIENPSDTCQKDTFCLVEFVKYKYSIFNLSVINKGNASDLDIYYMKVYYLFSKQRALKENSPGVPALKDLTLSFKAAKREFVKQLKRDFKDCPGQRQEV